MCFIAIALVTIMLRVRANVVEKPNYVPIVLLIFIIFGSMCYIIIKQGDLKRRLKKYWHCLSNPFNSQNGCMKSTVFSQSR